MSEALDKALGALAAIAADGNYDGSNPSHLDLLMLARVQADIAKAAALENIFELLEDGLRTVMRTT